MLCHNIRGDRTTNLTGIKRTGILPELAGTTLRQPFGERVNRQDMTDQITLFVRIVNKLNLGVMNFAEVTEAFHFTDRIEIASDIILLAHRRQAIMKPAQCHLLASAIPDQHFVQTPPLAGLRFTANDNGRAKDLLRPDLQLADAAQLTPIFITAGESKEEIVNGLQTQTVQALQKSRADPAK